VVRDRAATSRIPVIADATTSTQPLLRQALHDCLHDACDVDGLASLLERLERGAITVRIVESSAPSPAAYGFVTARPPAFLDSGALMDRRTRGVRAPASGAPPSPLASLRHLRVESETAVRPEAVARVRREVAPDLATLEDATAQLQLAGILTEDEIGRTADGGAFVAALADAGRALRLVADGGAVLWGAVERGSELAALYPAARTSASALGGAPAPCEPAEALARLLAGRLESSGPVTVGDVVHALGLPEALVRAALDRLVAGGTVLRGHHDPVRPDEPTWCERRVLARIERLTRNQLRAEIDAVPIAVFRRFLLEWHGLTPSARRRGREGVVAALACLDGIELPVGAWEASVLPARVGGYDLDLLDEVCLSGAFGWGRLSPTGGSTDDGERRAPFTRTTPVALFCAEHLDTWRAFASATGSSEASRTYAPSPHAAVLLDWLTRRGPSFLGQIERALVRDGDRGIDAPLDAPHLELAMLELVGAGMLTADAFAAVRGLLARPAKWGVPRLVRLANANVGRWSLLPPWEPLADPVARDRAVERHARALLRRYGVVVRPLAQQESSPAATAVRWGELLRVLRRLEARGEVRGGYFVAGAGGEHFALPEAIPLLREVQARGVTGSLVALSAADPLNLTGVLDDAPRVASRATGRVLLEDGAAIGALDGRRAVSLRAGVALTDVQHAALRADIAPAALAAFT
jgi:ATP-dependent Lhr-like helicase